MRIDDKHLYAFAALVGGAGLLIHLWVGFNGFGRSGAVIVAFTIAGLIWTNRVNETYHRNLFQPDQEADCWRKDGTSAGRPANKLEKMDLESLIRFLAKENSAKEERMKRLIYCEAVLLVAGTLIWGFGDLVPECISC